MLPFGLRPEHLIIIAIVALIIFGPRRLPEIGRGLGKALNEFRLGAKEMTDSFRNEIAQGGASNPVRPPEAPASIITASQRQVHEDHGTSTDGASGEQVFCNQCGAPNPQGAHFCNHCGQPIQVIV